MNQLAVANALSAFSYEAKEPVANCSAPEPNAAYASAMRDGQRQPRLWQSLLATVLACTPEVTPSRSISAAIFGGQPAPNDVSVFYLAMPGGGGCSAALIAPRTLLTAAHCVDLAPQWASNTLIGGSGTRYPVTKWASYSGVPGDWSPDLGLVLLETAPPVPALRWKSAGPFPPVGSLVRHVGYGLTESGSAGERRQLELPISGANEPRLFGVSLVSGASGRSICFGDSGGPALTRDAQGELIAAVHSYTHGCGGSSGSALVFPYRKFIERWLLENEAASCARDSRCVEGCTPADLDCTCGPDGQCTAACVDGDDPDCPPGCGPDGTCQPQSVCPTDLDCLPLGTRCLRESQCAGRVCTADPQNPTRYCSVTCSMASPCSAGFECDLARGVCTKTQRQLLPAGAPCGAGELCEMGLICSDGRGLPYRCLETCESNLSCPRPLTCDFSKRVCVAPRPITLDAGTEWVGALAPLGGCSVTPFPLMVLAVLALALGRKPDARHH